MKKEIIEDKPATGDEEPLTLDGGDAGRK